MTLQCPKVRSNCWPSDPSTASRTTPLNITTKRRVYITSKLCAARNHYDVLGVPRNANAKQIKEAYYKLAMKHHPDKNQGKLTERFREIKEAYDVLSNESNRINYNNSKYRTTRFQSHNNF